MIKNLSALIFYALLAFALASILLAVGIVYYIVSPLFQLKRTIKKSVMKLHKKPHFPSANRFPTLATTK